MSVRDQAVRVAVVGTGAISQVVHAPILAERDDVELVALSDLDMHKAETLSRRFGAPLVMEPEEAVHHEGVDAIFVCTPNATHEPLAVAALEAGKHVFVERPLATTAEGVRRILDAARRAGRSVVVGLPHRFRPETAALRSFVAGGELGAVYTVRSSWLTRSVPQKPTWRHDPTVAGGGALVDLGVPALDLCLWMVDYPPIERVFCRLLDGEFGVEDAANLLFVSSEGVTFSVEVSTRYFAREDRFYARVMGTEGSGSLPPLEVFKQLGGRPLEVTPRQPRPRGGEDAYTNAYRRLIDHFVRVVAGEAEAPLPEDQIALMALVEAAYASAASDAEVSL